MKKFYLTILMTLVAFSCHAKITQVNDMKEVFEYFADADSKTLAIFDVDMVLVQPSDPAFQMANMKRCGAISKRIMKEVPAEKQMMFLSLTKMRTKMASAHEIEVTTPQAGTPVTSISWA